MGSRDEDRLIAANLVPYTCEESFSNPHRYEGQLRSLLTENFAIIGEQKPNILY
jgi:hypothetical protein